MEYFSQHLKTFKNILLFENSKIYLNTLHTHLQIAGHLSRIKKSLLQKRSKLLAARFHSTLKSL